MKIEWIANAFTLLIALGISITLHEAAHAFVATWFGDSTPERDGRKTLNPIVHMDPLGIGLPVVLALINMPFLLGWGKPVNVDGRNMRWYRTGFALTALAGPIMNLLVCAFCILLVMLYQRYWSAAIPQGHVLYPFVTLTQYMINLNAILAIFNLLPFPPLDGGTLLPMILPQGAREIYEDYIAPYGFFIFLALMISGAMDWVGRAAKVYLVFAISAIEALLNMF